MKCFTSVFVAATLTACGGKQVSLDKAPIVATIDGTMMTADLSLLKDTVIFPLSTLTEELKFVRLDPADEALVYPASVEVSDNYILVKGGTGPRGGSPMPCKLFDKSGKFISNVGSIGQGPGEYRNIYAMQLDEAAGRIYLMPWTSRSVLVYDLTGKALDPIPLPYIVPKSVFRVEGDKLGVAILAFKGSHPSVAWVQKLDGTVLDTIASGDLAVRPDFSNEIFSGHNTDAFDFSYGFWPSRVDSLYHLDIKSGMMTPKFTANFGTKEPPTHSYAEWPNYYVGTTNEITVVTGPDGQRLEGKRPAFYVVDKKSGRGSYFRVENDWMGGENMDYPVFLFDKGYYSTNIEPTTLEEWIDRALASTATSDTMRKKLTELKGSITPDDNNYVVYAKLK
jgi:hypothetical protein